MSNITSARQVRLQRGSGLAFLLGFLKRPDLVGSVVPSSRFLERRIVNVAAIAQARLAVEFGPGTGGTTRAILEALPGDGKLLAIEINPEFASRLRANHDPRLIVHQGSAEHIQETLSHYELARPDAIVSGIPFSTMPLSLGRQILHSLWSCLAPGGRFVAYQFREQVAVIGRDLLGNPDIELELLNVPPVRVFCWRKPDEMESPAPPG